MEEMRRLGSGTMPASGPARRSGAQAADAAKRPLAERINDPRVARLVRQEGEEAQAADDGAGASLSRAGSAGFSRRSTRRSAEARVEHARATSRRRTAGRYRDQATRKARLLDRITGLDKNSA